MYLTWDDNGDVGSPLSATQFENLYIFVHNVLLKVDGDQTKPPAHVKEHANPLIPADAVFEGGSVDEYATPISANWTKTAYVNPARLA
jgi:hypothetical protein